MKSGRRVRSMYLGNSEVFQCAMVVLCSVVLYGCASTETKQIIDNDIVSSIKPGKTTKAEVETILGKPYGVSTYEVLVGPEEEEWVYMYMDDGIVAPTLVGAGIGFASGLPVVGGISAAVAGKVMYSGKVYFLPIRFSKEGVVKQVGKCETTAGGYKTTCENY